MNLYTFMIPDLDIEGGEEVNSRRVNFLKGAIGFIKNRRQANRLTKNPINQDRYGAHDCLVAAIFSEDPMYDAYKFRKTFRMACPLFNRIVNEVTNHDEYFRNNIDCTIKEGISPFLNCTTAIRQLAYGVNADFLVEYLQMSERSSRVSLDHFCKSVIKNFGPEYLRKPTITNVEKLYRHHEEKHGFTGMLESLDCTDWEWFGCLVAFKVQYVRRDHGPNPFILLEVVASQDLWT
ncbi:reverse transcriptase domain-containing protein [Tanacetum coccineum]